jgi:adiponectin receptor
MHLNQLDEKHKYLADKYILTGYAPRSNIWEAITKSPFTWHNETLNIWTHLIPGIIYLYTFGQWYEMTHQIQPTSNSIHTWPVTLYLLSASLTYLFSATSHILVGVDKYTYDTFAQVDYVGIFLSIGSQSLPHPYYVFYDDVAIRNGYVLMMLIGYSTIIIVATYLGGDELSKRTVLRIGLYSIPVISSIGIPYFHIIHTFGFHSEQAHVLTNTMAYEVPLFLIVLTLYVARIPERWFPAKFDYFGHSHHYWHIGTFLVAYYYRRISVLDAYKWCLYRHSQ